MASDHTPTCETCRWWEDKVPRNADLLAVDCGECRRNPPVGGQFVVYLHRDPETERAFQFLYPWPPTHKADWCGEHQPKEPADD